MQFSLCTKLILIILLITNPVKAQDLHKRYSEPPKTHEELKASIKAVLKEAGIKAAGIATINPDGSEWMEAFGYSDFDNRIRTTGKTMFRLGSISKMYVALAILKLKEEEKLTLKDRVRDLVPEIKFYNPWSDSNPVTVEQLLEHTTGWCYWKFAEFASNDPTPLKLKDALNMYPDSRTSQWVPGTRHLYSNSGPAVAAYIVEKLSGRSFENYIAEYFFKPMNSEYMTFFNSPYYKKHRAHLYDNNHKTEYFHMLMRPSGSLNASPEDMLKMIRLFINRGTIQDNQILKPDSFDRMERSETLPVSSSGMFLYGLANHAAPYKQFIYRSHGGSVPGGDADFAYLPGMNTGYAVMINTNNQEALTRIVNLIKGFQTSNLTVPPVETEPAVISDRDLTGYYMPVNPKFRFFAPFTKLKRLVKLFHKEDKIVKTDIFNKRPKEFKATQNNRFISVKTGRVGMALANDPIEGEVIHAGEIVLRKTSRFIVFFQLSVLVLWFLVLITTPVTALIRGIIFLFPSRRDKKALLINILPFLTSLCIFALSPAVMMADTHYGFLRLMGTVNTGSIMFMLLSLLFGILSVWSALYIFRNRKAEISVLLYSHSAAASLVHLTVAVYLLINGYIGVQVWNW